MPLPDRTFGINRKWSIAVALFRNTLLAAAVAVLAASGAASAAEISGAGATFPYPIYAKWAEAYKAEDRDQHELPVDRLGRRHQADHRQDGRFRRHATCR